MANARSRSTGSRQAGDGAGVGRERALLEGDRVRIVQADSEYTGCRGSVTGVALDDVGEPVGYWVAVDGENGIARPFLPRALVRQAAARARGRATSFARQA